MSDHTRLEVWRLADDLVKSTYPLIKGMSPRDRTLGDQLWRAMLSVSLNIVEGYARRTPKQLNYHLNVAIASLTEAIYLLDLAAQLGVLPASSTAKQAAAGRLLTRKLGAFLVAIQEGRSRHSRFRESQ